MYVLNILNYLLIVNRIMRVKFYQCYFRYILIFINCVPEVQQLLYIIVVCQKIYFIQHLFDRNYSLMQIIAN